MSEVPLYRARAHPVPAAVVRFQGGLASKAHRLVYPSSSPDSSSSLRKGSASAVLERFRGGLVCKAHRLVYPSSSSSVRKGSASSPLSWVICITLTLLEALCIAHRLGPYTTASSTHAHTQTLQRLRCEASLTHSSSSASSSSGSSSSDPFLTKGSASSPQSRHPCRV